MHCQTIRSQMVRDFHRKQEYPLDLVMPKDVIPEVEVGRAQLASFSKSILQKALENMQAGDPRLYRVHLLAEECAELIGALARGDEVAVADGAGDLLYVVLGTLETYNIPSEEVFSEIHYSNMSKQKRTEENARLRDKGPDYYPPEISEAIKRGRRRRAEEEVRQQEENNQ